MTLWFTVWRVAATFYSIPKSQKELLPSKSLIKYINGNFEVKYRRKEKEKLQNDKCPALGWLAITKALKSFEAFHNQDR